MARPDLIISVEDTRVADFFPLTCLRPIGLLRSGILPLFTRLKRTYPETPFVLGCRDAIAPLVREQFPELPVNADLPPVHKTLIVSSRLRTVGDLASVIDTLDRSTRLVHESETVGIVWMGALPAGWNEARDTVISAAGSLPTQSTTSTLYRGLWEIMADIGDEISADFAFLSADFPRARSYTLHDGAYLLASEKIYLSEGVEIMPGVVLDARPGPIVIGAHTRLEPQTTIIGPCYIGPNCLVPFGRIADCSIGEVCRAGGEIEASIFQSHTNKYHAGFIGHSYVGSWVNFGAMTTNSDLKNNYSTIRVVQNENELDSGSIKVGSFIGDHTKFGIGTLLNTGITIGTGCNLFGGALITDKKVDAFSWGSSGHYQRYALDKALETVRRTMSRRNVNLSKHETLLLSELSYGRVDMQGVFHLD